MRVLIAEDDIATRRLLETYLKKWGYEVIAASDGNKAWECLQLPDSPHLVILDWMMPGLDGIEICRRVRQMESGNLKHIILLTARGAKEDLVAGFEAGASDYITKRFDSDELRARIRVGARVVELQNALAHRVTELEEAITHIKTLQGILPICMHCHKIRDDREIWQRLEEYITGHTQAMLSHSLCPECFEKFYPEYSSRGSRSDSKK
ncbi:MAG: response regulator [Pseudomonadota bacterium]